MAIPAYQRVYESLSKKIVTGEYPVGSLLPSEPLLEKIYHVSRITVRRAVELLERNGFVQCRQGIGTTVLNFHATQNLNKITSFTQTLTKAGYVVSYKKCDIDVISADQKLADVLSINLGDSVVRFHRVVMASGKPISTIYNYIAYENVPDIEKHPLKFTSLYEFLAEKYFISFDMAQDTLRAIVADAALAEELEIEKGYPILASERRALYRGKCLSYDVTYTRGDMYSFNVTLFN